MPEARAILLLEREWYQLQQEPLWGIEAGPLRTSSTSTESHYQPDVDKNGQSNADNAINDHNILDHNLLHWSATIRGYDGTAWEGGVFRVDIQFGNDYDTRAPRVRFLTVPFHPNVDAETGRPCVAFLDDPNQWLAGSYTVRTVLIYLQFLLANPVVDGTLANPMAAELMLGSRRFYEQLVMDCVVASRRVEAGLPAQVVQPAGKVEEQPETVVTIKDTHASSKERPHIHKLSFDSYHASWRDTATTKRAAHKEQNMAPSQKLLQKTSQQQPQSIAEAVRRGKASIVNGAALSGKIPPSTRRHPREIADVIIADLVYSQELAMEADLADTASVLPSPPVHAHVPTYTAVAKSSSADAAHLTPRQVPAVVLPNASSTGPVADAEWENEADDLVQWSNNLQQVDH